MQVTTHPFNQPLGRPTWAQPSEPAFAIKKGVPIPRKYSGKNGTTAFPFEVMEVGDCFDVQEGTKAYKQISARASQFAKKAGKKFTTRTVYEGTRKIIRVWRIA